MMGSTTNRDSKDILYLVKEGTVGAEIGVWMGNTSINFAKKNPAELHLVDSWSIEPYKESTEHGSYENYLKRYSNVCGGSTEEQFQAKYDQVYESVVNKFKGMPNVYIHRMSSDKWFDQRKDNSLDWIYVDGDHSYEGCLRDLENAFRVVKSGGLILGDDYQWPFQKHGKDGVTAAVKYFVNKNKLQLNHEGSTSQFSIEVP